MKHEVHFQIDTEALRSYTDTHLAALWHIAQANPAPHGDRDAGCLAEHVGREIIVRFLRHTAPELWCHQGSDHTWKALTEHCKCVDGAWMSKDSEPQPVAPSMDEHFALVPARLLNDGRHVAAFWFAKYPAAKGEAGTVLHSPSAKPWVNITRADALAACQESGFDLSRESQEIAIRLDVCEQDINWTGGKVGVGKVYQGLHKGSVSSAQAADYVSDDPEERSWHQLSTGERVYGLAGNICTHVFDDIQGDGRGVVNQKFAADSPSIAAAPYPSRENGMGWRPDADTDLSGDALVRGGYWDGGDNAGVFSLGGMHPSDACDDVGFRCTKPA